MRRSREDWELKVDTLIKSSLLHGLSFVQGLDITPLHQFKDIEDDIVSTTKEQNRRINKVKLQCQEMGLDYMKIALQTHSEQESRIESFKQALANMALILKTSFQQKKYEDRKKKLLEEKQKLEKLIMESQKKSQGDIATTKQINKETLELQITRIEQKLIYMKNEHDMHRDDLYGDIMQEINNPSARGDFLKNLFISVSIEHKLIGIYKQYIEKNLKEDALNYHMFYHRIVENYHTVKGETDRKEEYEKLSKNIPIITNMLQNIWSEKVWTEMIEGEKSEQEKDFLSQLISKARETMDAYKIILERYKTCLKIRELELELKKQVIENMERKVDEQKLKLNGQDNEYHASRMLPRPSQVNKVERLVKKLNKPEIKASEIDWSRGIKPLSPFTYKRRAIDCGKVASSKQPDEEKLEQKENIRGAIGVSAGIDEELTKEQNTSMDQILRTNDAYSILDKVYAPLVGSKVGEEPEMQITEDVAVKKETEKLQRNKIDTIDAELDVFLIEEDALSRAGASGYNQSIYLHRQGRQEEKVTNNFPVYTYSFNVDTGKWSSDKKRVRQAAIQSANDTQSTVSSKSFGDDSRGAEHSVVSGTLSRSTSGVGANVPLTVAGTRRTVRSRSFGDGSRGAELNVVSESLSRSTSGVGANVQRLSKSDGIHR